MKTSDGIESTGNGFAQSADAFHRTWKEDAQAELEKYHCSLPAVSPTQGKN